MVFEKVLAGPWYESLIKKSKEIAKLEYKKNYEEIYLYILKFIKKNKYIISNLELLSDQPLKYDKPLQIFVLNPNEVSSELFKKLCGDFGSEFALRIEMDDQHYSIDHYSKHYIRISYINQYKNVSLIDFLTPIIRDDLVILPPILELIDIYKKIYNPEFADDWEDLIGQAHRIQEITDRHISESINKFKGGRRADAAEADDNAVDDVATDETTTLLCKVCNDKGCKSCREIRQEKIADLKQLVLAFLDTYKDYVIMYHPNDIAVEKNIELISPNNIKTDFERLYNYLNKVADYPIVFKRKNLFVGKDLRIVKHSFYLNIAKYGSQWNIIKKPFLDIYNNASYELIPYEGAAGHAYLKIAHPWVQIRFRYIEIWNILAAYHLGLLKYEQIRTYIENNMAAIKKINIRWGHQMPYNYIGIYYNEYQAYKQAMLLERKNMKIYCSSA